MTEEPPPKPKRPAAARSTTLSGLSACSVCGFEARGTILKASSDKRHRAFCYPCGLAEDAVEPELCGCVAVWIPETSQAAACQLVRTAYVILHLHDALHAGLPRSDAGHPGHEPPRDTPGLVLGALRVVYALGMSRADALARIEAKRSRRGDGAGDEDGRRLRLAPGIRHVPDEPSPEEIEAWIEGGGTYAGWTRETLAAQVS